MPKPLMNWFERRMFLKHLAAAGSWAVGASAFATTENDDATDVPDDLRMLLEATAWRSYAVSGPGENAPF